MFPFPGGQFHVSLQGSNQGVPACFPLDITGQIESAGHLALRIRQAGEGGLEIPVLRDQSEIEFNILPFQVDGSQGRDAAYVGFGDRNAQVLRREGDARVERLPGELSVSEGFRPAANRTLNPRPRGRRLLVNGFFCALPCR